MICSILAILLTTSIFVLAMYALAITFITALDTKPDGTGRLKRKNTNDL